jgi:glycolate oxidase iron-sulfur subunit
MAAQPSAFDDVRPPPPELIDDCVHCGFCLPTCPTYALWGEEMDTPRGRILLMRAGHEEPELTAPQVQAWDNCLGCMACVTACPSGVQYDKLIEDTRQQVERRWQRPRLERLRRRAIFALFPHPERMKWIAPFAPLAAPTARYLSRFPHLKALAQLAPPKPSRVRLPEVTPARGTSRGRVGFLQGCVQRVFFGDVNAATVGVLAAEGFEVWAPEEPGCCGALELHTGYDMKARARDTIAAFEGCETIVVNAAGCGSAMKDYGHLFRDDPAWAGRAEAFSAKVRDVHELLADVEPQAERKPLDLTVAYHDACHLAHAQGVRSQPRELLRTIPGLELREPADWELCCGSAGIYNLLEPKTGRELGSRKAAAILAAEPDIVATANPGCAIQIAAALRRAGHPGLPIVHPVELVAASLA